MPDLSRCISAIGGGSDKADPALSRSCSRCNLKALPARVFCDSVASGERKMVGKQLEGRAGMKSCFGSWTRA